MLGDILVTNGTMTKDWNQPDDTSCSSAARRRRHAAGRERRCRPVAKVQTLQEFKDEPADQVNQLLGLVACSRCR